jgi:lysophospholipase L1-like esterase
MPILLNFEDCNPRKAEFKQFLSFTTGGLLSTMIGILMSLGSRVDREWNSIWRPPMERNRPMLAPGQYTIVAFGDSITASRDVAGTALTVYADILRTELPNHGITGTVQNKGVGGNTTADARQRFQADVLDPNPDLVIMMFGMNDSAIDVWNDPPAAQPRVSPADFAGNLTAMVRILKDRGVQAILVSPNPRRWHAETLPLYGKPPYDPKDPNGFNLLHDEYAREVCRVAREQEAGLIDAYGLFRKYGRFEALLLDGVHLNDAGQRLVAEALIKVITSGRKGGG